MLAAVSVPSWDATQFHVVNGDRAGRQPPQLLDMLGFRALVVLRCGRRASSDHGAFRATSPSDEWRTTDMHYLLILIPLSLGLSLPCLIRVAQRRGLQDARRTAHRLGIDEGLQLAPEANRP